MSDNEVNKIIAEFMGVPVSEISQEYIDDVVIKYTKSLDALVPVWEKLQGLCNFRIYWDICRPLDDEDKHKFELITFTGSRIYSANGKLLSQAAAHATAKAIMELNNNAR